MENDHRLLIVAVLFVCFSPSTFKVGLQSCLSLIVAQFAVPLPLTNVLTEEVDAEIAGNKQNNDDHTDDGEDVHAALISLQSGELRVSSRVHSSRCYPALPIGPWGRYRSND